MYHSHQKIHYIFLWEELSNTVYLYVYIGPIRLSTKWRITWRQWLSWVGNAIGVLHQQKVFLSLEASRSVWEDVESKLRCINIRRVSDHRSAFRPGFRVTGISDYWYRNAMGVIVESLRTPRSARENFGCPWEHLGVPARTLGALTTTLGAPTTTLGAPATSLGAPRIPAEQSGKNIIFFRNAAGAPRYC